MPVLGGTVIVIWPAVVTLPASVATRITNDPLLSGVNDVVKFATPEVPVIVIKFEQSVKT
jgi:hypothetical protein